MGSFCFVYLLLLVHGWCSGGYSIGQNEAGGLNLYRQQPVEVPVQDDVVQLVCEASGLQAGYVIEWARLVITGTGEMILARGGTSFDQRVSVTIKSRESPNRAEILSIIVDVQDAGDYYCRVRKSNRANGTLVRSRSYSLTVHRRPTTTEAPSSSDPVVGSTVPWIAASAGLLILLMISVIINVYVIIKRRHSTRQIETSEPTAEPYTELQRTGGHQSHEYMGLNATRAEGTSEVSTGPHTYYQVIAGENEGLQYNYARPDDIPNPVHQNTGAGQYRNMNV